MRRRHEGRSLYLPARAIHRGHPAFVGGTTKTVAGVVRCGSGQEGHRRAGQGKEVVRRRTPRHTLFSASHWRRWSG
jgi:hypothetical protein